MALESVLIRKRTGRNGCGWYGAGLQSGSAKAGIRGKADELCATSRRRTFPSAFNGSRADVLYVLVVTLVPSADFNLTSHGPGGKDDADGTITSICVRSALTESTGNSSGCAEIASFGN